MAFLSKLFRPDPGVSTVAKDLSSDGSIVAPDTVGIPLANNPDFALVGGGGGWLGGLFGGFGNSSTGIPVTPQTALQAADVYACVRVLAEDLAKLDLNIQTRLDRGGWVVDEDHPLNTVFRFPNQLHSNFDFIAMIGAQLALRGNAYIAVLRDYAGRPVQLVPISADHMSVVLSQSGQLFYRISTQSIQNGAGIVLSREDVMHIRSGISTNGYIGVSPIDAASNAIGLSIALELHGNKFFANGTSLSGYLEMPGKLSPERRRELSDQLARAHSGIDNAGKTLILEAGSKFTPAVMTSEQAQYLGSRAASTIQIARLFRVPPSKLQEHGDSHFNNIESMNMDYVQNTLAPIAKRIEQEAERVLLFNRELTNTRIRFDFDSELRGDITTRYNAAAVGITNGFISRNEARARENLPPVEGGDEMIVPLNMGTAGPKPDSGEDS